MTGFGQGQAAGENFSVGVEIKTVNNRFLDVNLRLAGELQTLETPLKRLITNRLARGRVEVFVNVEQTGDVAYEINRPLVSGYLSALREMRDEFSLTGEPDLNMIARLPNVLQTKKDDLNEPLAAAVEQACVAALDELEKMREVEGEILRNELQTRVSEIENLLPRIELESENITEEYRLRLNKRIENLLKKTDSQIELDQARLAQEVAFLADKSDISEEISRLKSHLEQFRSILKEETEVGKKLDFLTQELNREANTIASKTNNLTIKEAALAMKAEIEKIREQIQNAE
ncbi:MAG TPA: YicC/YloC family endoribonuclease, partial [Pyrinomonadaceae bacterium]|nr:YicC/YloC family endoribonuclease [Pyrinomonadaceae bacterium]